MESTVKKVQDWTYRNRIDQRKHYSLIASGVSAGRKQLEHAKLPDVFYVKQCFHGMPVLLYLLAGMRPENLEFEGFACRMCLGTGFPQDCCSRTVNAVACNARRLICVAFFCISSGFVCYRKSHPCHCAKESVDGFFRYDEYVCFLALAEHGQTWS